MKGADILEKIAPTNKSPLHLAAEKSYSDCVDILLNGLKSVTPPVSPMHQAATNSKSKKKSLSQDSMLAETIGTIVDSNGETPLHAAARENNREICERLLLYGFDLNFKSLKIMKALLRATVRFQN